MNCAMASDLLLHKSGADMKYIERIGAWKAARPDSSQSDNARMQKSLTDTGGKSQSVPSVSGGGKEGGAKEEVPDALGRVKDAVLKGNKRHIVELTESALEAGLGAKEVLDHALLPGIDEVGALFDQGKYFLPQLIAGAEAMKLAIEHLEPLLAEDKNREKLPVVVIATVKGDIHDIGKNLVALMLKNHGFQVVDLGKDVPKEVIVEEAMKRQAAVIALSALMTTTMQEMRHVVSYAREQGCTAQIIIGGAVITQDFADEIGADGYSRDAAEAVKLTRRILRL